MIEYHAHEAVFAALKGTLPNAFSNEPALTARVKQLVDAANADNGAAILGSLVDALLDHAGSDGVELQFLEQAASLWKRGLSAYDELALARQEFELATSDPSKPGAVAVLQSSVNRLAAMKTSVTQLAAEMQTLRDQIAPMPHLKAHGRQFDRPSSEWSVKDAFLGRRTDAFVAALVTNANDATTSALAFGAISGLAGNAAGSAYLGAVVGGPRRLHRYRDRIARNTLGAWLKANTAATPLGVLAREIGWRGLDGEPALPPAVEQALTAAFDVAYPTRDQPNWRLGLKRTVRHLELLESFSRPAAPQPPMTFLSLGGDDIPGTFPGDSGDPTSGGDPGEPSGVFGPSVPLGPDMKPMDPGKPDSSPSAGDICIGILIALGIGAILVLIGLVIFCIFQLADQGECKPEEYFNVIFGSEEPNPNQTTGISQGQLNALSTPDAQNHILQEIFKIQMTAWQAFDLSLAYLTVTGLIYPDDLLITSPLYQQFLRVPQRNAWPHSEEPDPQTTYHLDPVSPVEGPATVIPFPVNATPTRLLAPWPSDYDHAAASVAVPFLRRLFLDQDDINLDLDADRGFEHPCWGLATGSIHDPILAVQILPYGEE